MRSGEPRSLSRRSVGGGVKRRASSFAFYFTQPFGRPPRPAGRHQFERTLVVRIRERGGQIAARAFTSKALND